MDSLLGTRSAIHCLRGKRPYISILESVKKGLTYQRFSTGEDRLPSFRTPIGPKITSLAFSRRPGVMAIVPLLYSIMFTVE